MGQFHLAVNFKVTVHVGKDQNIEIEIFEEYKYTLNDFQTKRLFFFNTSDSLRDMANGSFTGSKLYKAAYFRSEFSKHVLATEDVNRAGGFRNSAPIIFI